MVKYTSVEQSFLQNAKRLFPTNVPYVTVENFPALGLMTALRFLEWVHDHPAGVVSLPTGKTPEYFITWTKRILAEWDSPEGHAFRERNGLLIPQKPDLSGLHFVQIDEFYPISPAQHNSFYNYVQKYYVSFPRKL